LYENGCDNFEVSVGNEVPQIRFVPKGIAEQIVQSSGQDAMDRAVHTLLEYRAYYQLCEADIKQFKLQHIHDIGAGPIVVIFKQDIDGLEVYKERFSVVLSQELHPIAISGSLPTKESYQNHNFKLNILDILKILIQDSIGKIPHLKSIQISKKNNYNFAHTRQFSEICQPIRFKQILHHIGYDLISSFYLEIYLTVGSSCNLFNYIISAETGAILVRQSMTHYANYRVWASTTSHTPADGPLADFTPHPTGTPDGSYPSFAAPSLVSISTSDPWLPIGAFQASGNNVNCFADITAPDGFNSGDIQVDATSPDTFDHTYDVTQDPASSSSQAQASALQAFYTLNWLHDFFYDSGFDEQFNAQADNYNRGGLSGDAIQAETQDFNGDGYQFAQISTPADGSSPIMQLNVLNSVVTVSITSDPAHTYTVTASILGPSSFDLTGNTVVASDGTAPSTDACQAIVNNVAGTIVVIEAGSCSSATAVSNAQSAGAIGVIYIGSFTGSTVTVYIPVIGVSADDGTFLKSASVTAHMVGSSSVRRDMSIDNTVVAHEWGHYLVARLSSMENNQGRSLAEGYSDFVALLMSLQSGDNVDGTYAIGIYAAQLSDNAGYYGIRRVPYSTDMTKNGLLFEHISDSATLPSTPTSTIYSSPSNSDVQNSGEVWATVLWECYIGLVKEGSIAQAQTRMKNYIVASLKAMPSNPTFTEARDSLLAVAAASDSQDAEIFYTAFAKRGLGTFAVSPKRTSLDHFGVLSSFDDYATLQVIDVTLLDNITSCDNDGIMDQMETGTLLVTIKNPHLVQDVTYQTTLSANSSYAFSFTNGNSVSIPTFSANSESTIALQVSLPTLTGRHLVQFAFTLENTLFSSTETAYFYINYDHELANSTTETVEIETTSWSTSTKYNFPYSLPTLETVTFPSSLSSISAGWSRTEHNGDYVWYGEAIDESSDIVLVSPGLFVGNSLVISFDHEYSFEENDGAVIELYDEIMYYDITSLANITLQNMTSPSNSLYDLNVITGTSAGMSRVTIDLGTTYQGKSLYLRFRIATDNAMASGGWYIDNIQLNGIINTPFTTIKSNVCQFTVPTTTSTTSTTSTTATTASTTTSTASTTTSTASITSTSISSVSTSSSTSSSVATSGTSISTSSTTGTTGLFIFK
jgi:hypothetical protein